MENCIEASDLGFAYSTQLILANVNFALKKSESLAILGQSGCGKSTLLRLIHQLLTPDDGSIHINGQSSILFQDDRLLPWKTCMDNVRLALARRSLTGSAQTEQITCLFKKLQIPEVSNQYPHTLSGGMRQRVALARALINQPDLLLLDEPFAAVDHFTRQALIVELHQLRQTNPVSMVLVTHNIDEALFLSDRILILGNTPTSVQYSVEIPGLPTDWQNFYQSKKVASIKVDILSILDTLQQ
ncbi:ATP-binding cassette domain-containing protein [Endozoicomonas gorgoniicola]|uniref:ATP-binding cassette domain-containing protein n=1 Tax=Endozoicomonas gorgoniicola TaxID=1234144 RepID=A0ABT3N4Q2_9GAMM|nr:ATP-binding cassette domain-containing protein [Endozoicomonas gorgoniicola]MCW7556333.1 ATP-binding cassette domain-containing protein [Endozoicomonas gorgoniicola]